MARILSAAAVYSLAVGVQGNPFTVPIQWAQPEGRLVFQFGMNINGEWKDGVSRVDFGSQRGLQATLAGCVMQSCTQCPNKDCACSTEEFTTCPDGSSPGSAHGDGKGRSIRSCPQVDVDFQLPPGGASMKLPGNLLGPVDFMVSDAGKHCPSSVGPNTGFSHGSPFLAAIYHIAGMSVFSLSQKAMQVSFGTLPSQSHVQVKTPFFMQSGHGGRSVKIVAVNGKQLSSPCTTAIDTGNGSFLSYGPGSPLIASLTFPFSVTFDGGNTLTFHSAPAVNGQVTRSAQYSHNVLALGFMSEYTISFDDSNNTVYFSDAMEEQAKSVVV